MKPNLKVKDHSSGMSSTQEIFRQDHKSEAKKMNLCQD
jgi:hypothetical protein